MESDKTLAQVMHVLSLENKYSSKLYHYLEDIGIEPEECEINEIELIRLNKHEFGLLRNVNFEDLLIRQMIEDEKARRKA